MNSDKNEIFETSSEGLNTADDTEQVNSADAEAESESEKVNAENETQTPDTEEKKDGSELKKAKKQGREKMKSAYALKYGSYATATVAIVIALVICLNVFLNVLNQRFPMTVDFTTANEYTFDEENIEFLKGIDYKVELSVIFSESDYQNSNYMYNYRGFEEGNGGAYYTQTVELLKQYKKYNKNISVQFIDPFSTSSEDEKGQDISAIISEYTEHDLTVKFADILVKCWPDGDDAEPKLGVISAEDCYVLSADSESTLDYYNSGTSTQTITGNNIEQAVANGIFKTANLETVNVAVITANSEESYTDYLEETAKLNAYELTAVNMIMDTDLSKYDAMIICAPGADYSEDECAKISEWLDNDGKKGRILMYFASAASPELSNLHDLLEEWGIAYETGYKYYSKNELYYLDDQTNIRLETLKSDYTATVDSGSYSFIANNMIPMSAVYETETNGTRTVETVMQTEDYSVYKKPDGDKSWKATGNGDTRPAVMLSKDAGEESSSYVMAVSSVDFITNSDVATKSDNGNLRVVMNILNTTVRNDEDEYVMQAKLVSDTSGMFVTSTTEAQTVIIGIVFLGLIPIALIVIAIYIHIRRKNL